MGQLIPIRSYARYRAARGWVGTTHQAVRKRIERGQLDPAWKPMLGLIDCELADRLWPADDGRDAGLPTRQISNGHDSAASSPRAAAELRIALARAEAAELELGRRRGELIEVREVRSASLAIARRTRDAFMGLRRFGAVCAGLDAQSAMKLLEDEINRLLDEAVVAVQNLGGSKPPISSELQPGVEAQADKEGRP